MAASVVALGSGAATVRLASADDLLLEGGCLALAKRRILRLFSQSFSGPRGWQAGESLDPGQTVLGLAKTAWSLALGRVLAQVFEPAGLNSKL